MMRFPLSMFDKDMDTYFYNRPFKALDERYHAPYPPINISTTDKKVDVYLFLTGMNPDDIDLVIEKNMLSISGKRAAQPRDEENQAVYFEERFTGDFKRVVTLPDTVDTDTTEAIYKDGVLHITINKREETQPRQIKISS